MKNNITSYIEQYNNKMKKKKKRKRKIFMELYSSVANIINDIDLATQQTQKEKT